MNAPPDALGDDGPPLDGVEETTLEPGTYAGAYVIEGCIGVGVFGTVYRARHAVISAPAAVKVLKARYARDPKMINRFIDEARAASRASHPSIIDVFEFGRLPDGRRFIVMELLEGEGLDVLLAREGALDLPRTIDLLAPIAAALAAAHAAGVTHRDVKPANIFVCRAGPPKLVDFGVAKLLDERASVEATADGLSIGTPAYMSPEQCLGERATPACDVYALGVVAWQMLAGRLPFDAAAVVEVMSAHIGAAPPRLDRVQPTLSAAVGRAVGAMLAKDPAERPGPVAAIEALAACAQGRPPAGRWLVAALAAAVAAGGVAALTLREEPAKPEPIRVVAPQAPRTAAPPPPTAPATTAPPTAPPVAAPTSRGFTLTDLPAGAEIRRGDEALTLDEGGVLWLPTAGLPAEIEVSAPGHLPRTLSLTADQETLSGRLEPEPPPARARGPRRADPHGIDPW
ncbi:MAG: serine/threonine protein kinase [Myxococcales bacterium]|nr:serine/threonine protein kinase [Myxococcales bacterium]